MFVTEDLLHDSKFINLSQEKDIACFGSSVENENFNLELVNFFKTSYNFY